MPVSQSYTPDVRHTRLGTAFYDAVDAAEFPSHILRYRNDPWAARTGLETLSDAEWLTHFGRFEPLPGNLKTPLALRYHGHQFRYYNPDLGDGRGFLFAQVRDTQDGRLLDLATKGSGRTPWSRSGDGRLTLKGGVREVLATAMLEALGVYTSKSFSLIETGEDLMRHDEPSPTRSAVLVRLSHSHVRIGTFQRLAFEGDTESLKRLTDYAIETYWPDAANADNPVAAFYEHVCAAVARMGAEWMAAGFVHGVLNTDNIVITGESFDYGPWRFVRHYEPGCVAAYFDDTGLYAYGRQAESLHWNLARLGECLAQITDLDALKPTFEAVPRLFDEALIDQTHRRLAIRPSSPDSAARLTSALYNAMNETGLSFEQVFFDLIGGAQAARVKASPHALTYASDAWTGVLAMIRDCAPLSQAITAHDYFAARTRPVTLVRDDVETLWAAIDERDDWSLFEAKLREIAHLRDAYTAHLPGWSTRPAQVQQGAESPQRRCSATS